MAFVRTLYMTSDTIFGNDERETALRTLAGRLADDAENLLRLMDIPILADLTVAELLGAIRQERSEDRPRLRGLPAATSKSERDIRSRLSERELEVVRLIAEGLSNKEISVRLALSDKTVKNHISHILAKLNLTARTQVAVLALRAGIV